MKKLVVSIFIMVTASFFFVCGVSAVQHDVYAGFSVPSTFTFTDTVSYNVGNRSYGTAAYIDISWTWANYHNFYNNKGASISVASAEYYGQIELMSVSASDPTIDCSLDGNRIRIYFNSDYNGTLSITLTYACNYTWYRGSITGIPAPADSLQDVTMITNFTLTFGNMIYYDSDSIGMGDIDNKLNLILDSLGESYSTGSDYLGSDVLVYFRKDYFKELWANQTVLPNSDGLFVVPTVSGCSSLTFTNNSMAVFSISPGTYLVSFTCYFSNQPTSISFLGYPLDKFVCVPDWQLSNLYRVCGIFTVDNFSTYREVSVSIKGATFSPGVFYGGVSRAPDDAIASGAINPDQSGLVSDVDNAGQQQQAQEEQLWTNINSYKGDLTFNLDDWSEAAGGLSYVSGIFMSIWNNSPTQIIVLSLMLGIAMLSIGRGAMAAVRVSRNRRDDD